jgi:hypothetical protein
MNIMRSFFRIPSWPCLCLAPVACRKFAMRQTRQQGGRPPATHRSWLVGEAASLTVRVSRDTQFIGSNGPLAIPIQFSVLFDGRHSVERRP